MERKVLYVCSEFSPVSNAVAIRSGFHAASLLAAGFSVEVLTTGSSRTQPDSCRVVGVGLAAPSNRSGLVVRLLQEILVGFLMGVRIILYARKRPIVVISSPPFFMALICALAARLARLEYVADVRDRYPQVYFSLGLLRRASYFGRLLVAAERWFYRKASAVTTVTEFLRVRISAEAGVNVSIIRNGFDAEIFTPADPLAVVDQMPVVVMHGMFGRFFDAEAFLNIARYCYEHAPAHQFLVVGYGPKLDLIQAEGLENVVVSGRKTQSEIADILRRSAIGLSIHSSDESMLGAFPVKVFEYIGSALPILVMPDGEAGMHVRRIGGGLAIDNTRWEEGARWLVDVLSNPGSSQSMRRGILENRADYSRQAQASSFAQIVIEISLGVA